MVWTDDLCAGSIGWKCTLLLGLGSLVVGNAGGTVYIPFPFNCWHKTSISAVMAMKSCSLEWTDRMSHTPQRCSGRSNLGSPADCRNLSSASRMCWSLMATWMCWFSALHWPLHNTLHCVVPAESVFWTRHPCWRQHLQLQRDSAVPDFVRLVWASAWVVQGWMLGAHTWQWWVCMAKLVAACTESQEMVELVLMLSVFFVILHWWKAVVNWHQIAWHHFELFVTIACIPRLNRVWVWLTSFVFCHYKRHNVHLCWHPVGMCPFSGI